MEEEIKYPIYYGEFMSNLEKYCYLEKIDYIEYVYSDENIRLRILLTLFANYYTRKEYLSYQEYNRLFNKISYVLYKLYTEKPEKYQYIKDGFSSLSEVIKHRIISDSKDYLSEWIFNNLVGSNKIFTLKRKG